MRKVVAKENVITHGRFIELGALYVEDDRIPIVYAFDYNELPFGWATDFVRSPIGEISFDIELLDRFPFEPDTLFGDDPLFELSIFAQPVEFGNDGWTRVKKGRIRALSIIALAAHPSNPGAHFNAKTN